VGLTALLAGDRALLVGRAASVMTHRVFLRLADRTDLLLAGLPAKPVPTSQPPGRGVLLDGTEVQLALPASLAGCTDGTTGWPDGSVGPAASARSASRPWRVDALPHRVDAASLSRPAHDDWVPLGLGGDELTPLGLSPDRDGRRWIVAGSNGTGVSTTLVTIATELLARRHRVAVVATRAGPWGALRHDPLVLWCDDPAQPGELVALRRAEPGLAVLVDDADELLDSPVETALKQLAALVDRDDGLVVAGADATALSAQYRGLAVELARHRTGVLLGPASAAEADMFGVRVPVDRAAPCGRGYLVRGGVATPLQVATTGDAGHAPRPGVVSGTGSGRLRSGGDFHP
jgi:S-DNA-T family DNA segregation ATPase FtsK/SpoIIIE